MVGAALAGALAIHGTRVAVIEAREPERQWPAGDIANRVSALSRASQRILERLAAWPRMTGLGASPYRAMYVWDAGGSGHIRFDSAEVGEPDLGHIVENRVIQLALWERLEVLEPATLFCPARVADFELTEERVRVTLDDGTALDAALLVGTAAGQVVLCRPGSCDTLLGCISQISCLVRGPRDRSRLDSMVNHCDL